MSNQAPLKAYRVTFWIESNQSGWHISGYVKAYTPAQAQDRATTKLKKLLANVKIQNPPIVKEAQR